VLIPFGRVGLARRKLGRQTVHDVLALLFREPIPELLRGRARIVRIHEPWLEALRHAARLARKARLVSAVRRRPGGSPTRALRARRERGLALRQPALVRSARPLDERAQLASAARKGSMSSMSSLSLRYERERLRVATLGCVERAYAPRKRGACACDSG
jgi:hypothetical protein